MGMALTHWTAPESHATVVGHQLGQAMTRILCVGIAVVDFVFRYPRGAAGDPASTSPTTSTPCWAAWPANAAVAAAKLASRRR